MAESKKKTTTINSIKEFYKQIMQDNTLSIEERMLAAERLLEIENDGKD